MTKGSSGKEGMAERSFDVRLDVLLHDVAVVRVPLPAIRHPGACSALRVAAVKMSKAAARLHSAVMPHACTPSDDVTANAAFSSNSKRTQRASGRYYGQSQCASTRMMHLTSHGTCARLQSQITNLVKGPNQALS